VNHQPPAHAPQITASAALDLLAGDAVLIDVREMDEWQAGHAPMATHVPMSQLGAAAAQLHGLPRLIIVCRSGRRSDQVVGALVTAGFDAMNLDGGMQAWQQAGGDIVRDDGTPGVVM
jgi:rhodanese-related sulfurtransferase